MIDIVIKSSLIAVIAAICSAIFHRQSAAVRHGIWTAGLISALLAPVCTPLLPSWPVQPAPAPLNVLEPAPVASRIAETTPVSPPPMFSAADFVLYVWLAGAVVAAAWLPGWSFTPCVVGSPCEAGWR